MKLIARPLYLEQLKRVQGVPDIKVITGIRRCGKSKLMESFIDYIKTTDPAANVIYIDFTDLKYEELNHYRKLYDYAESSYLAGNNNYLFIDEVQLCEGFEKTLNSLHSSEKYDIYVTGSNAFLLSSDLATLFTGRTFSIEVFPFSLREFMEYHNLSDAYEAFTEYRKFGGMSGSYVYSDEKSRMSYLNNVFETLVLRDIVQKYKIRNAPLLEKITDYLMDNTSNIVSASNMAKTLQANKIKTNDKTIGTYIGYLCNAYGFYRIRRYDIRGKKYLAFNDKYYLADPAFRYARLGSRNPDYGRISENLVALELLRRGYEVYAGVLYKKEIDFVAVRQSEKLYIQVSEYIDNPETFEREYTPLLSIRDAYPKMILARTRHEEYQYEGIRIVDIADWLTAES
ncbi:ATP-binding protein [Succinimonas sp.]|uniref:ATP-binding protein n=1 Tax=Succinimonas sp. TaxID=1936151 RepID=UPI0038660EB1